MFSVSFSQANGNVSTKVYVGGIPYYSTEDDIRSYFEGCGTITEVDCMTFPESGKFRGIAIISFKVNNYVNCFCVYIMRSWKLKCTSLFMTILIRDCLLLHF